MNELFPRYQLTADYSISRIIKGHWQLSEGHLRQGNHDRDQLIRDMASFVESGITTFDMADIYTGTEELVGEFLNQYRSAFSNGTLPPVQIHTKYVPDKAQLHEIEFEDTQYIIDRSLKRLGVERLDLVQFHWWDYSIPRYVEVAEHLAKLQQMGKIRYIGVTNFNTQVLSELVESGVDIITTQNQYSPLDRRAEKSMIPYLYNNGITLLAYGTLAGGFLSSRYLGVDYNDLGPASLKNRSLMKYLRVIDDIGWNQYQDLLHLLSRIGRAYDVSPGTVAISYILSRPCVGASIVGGYTHDHLQRLLPLKNMHLASEDVEEIEETLKTISNLEDDCFELERYASRHRDLMKVNLNKESI